MTFTAHYMHRRHEKPDYWRTVAADGLNEAQKLADIYTRKGFVCVGIKQQLGKE